MPSSYSHERRLAWLFVGVVLVLMLAIAGAAALSATASAQEQADTPANESTPERTIDEQIADQLGDLVIHSYNYDDDAGAMTIEASWRGRAPTRATFVEMIELDSGGSTEISFQRVRLLPDERTEITVPADQRTGGTAAIMVTTPDSISNGDALILQDGDPDEYPALQFETVILVIGLTSVGSVGIAFVFVLRKKHDEQREVDRIA